jgi:hypothetical protein
MKLPILGEMDKCWFLLLNENISGPFAPEEIKSRVSAAGPGAQCLVWTKGQKQWLPAAYWEQNLDKIVSELPKPAHKTEEWYVGHNDHTIGPVSQVEIIKYLRGVDSFEWDAIRIWKSGQQNWNKIFQYPDILEEIGGSRRMYVRVPLNAMVVVNHEGEEQIGKATSISLGGMGIVGLKEMKIGHTLKLTIKADEFGQPVYVAAHVRYITPDGETGCQFQSLNMEFQARIQDYIKKFQASISPNKVAA